MRIRDYKMPAEFLASEMKRSISNIYIKAFVLGNIEPDILSVMKKMFCSLQKKECFGIQEYYRLGKLIHYREIIQNERLAG